MRKLLVLLLCLILWGLTLTEIAIAQDVPKTGLDGNDATSSNVMAKVSDCRRILDDPNEKNGRIEDGGTGLLVPPSLTPLFNIISLIKSHL